MKHKIVRTLSRIGLVVLALIGLLLMLYGYIFVASVTGRDTLQVGDLKRTYRVYLPSNYDETQPAPLLLALHMYTGSGRTMQWLTHLNKIADREGFMVVYPDGYQASWADGSGQFAADQARVDDFAYVSALLDKLQDDYAVDASRIYATGFSNGGFLAQRLACEMPDRFAAVATVGAVLSRDVIAGCLPNRPTAIMMINGTDDQGVPWDGDQDYTPVADTVAHWIQVNACPAEVVIRSEPDAVADGTWVKRSVYGPCQEGAEVVLYSIEGGGHTWPGGSKPVQLWGLNGRISQDMDASQVIWDFFQAHHR